jgi:hypothetical protein
LRRTPQIRLATIIGVVLLAGILTSCGSSTITPEPGTGTVIALVTDVPLCNAVSANLVIQGLSFTANEGAQPIPFINTTASLAPLIAIDMPLYRDFSTILYEFPVRSGTYSQANFNFDYGELAAYDPTLSPPIHIYTVTLTEPKPIVNLSPNLTITAGQANVILLDYDMQRTVLTDSSGNLNGQFTPTVSVTQLFATSPTGAVNPNGFYEIDDLWGFVRSVSTINTTSNANYIGSFQMQLLSPSVEAAPDVPVNLTNTTNKIGFADLGHLLPDSYVEADVILDSQGNLAAKTIEVQEVETPFPTQSGVPPSTALIGVITSITTDAGGNPTELNLWVRDAEPDDTSKILTDSIFQVDLTTNPTYQASIMGPNFANLSFGPKNLSVGQELVVHGAYTPPPAGTVTSSASIEIFNVEPTAIFLKLQSIQGTMNKMLAVGSDDETGVFILNPCCTMFNGTPIYVVTNNQTNYVSVTGLGAINTVDSLLVKGMPYYEPQSENINGVTIPAGTLVIQAKQVHDLAGTTN